MDKEPFRLISSRLNIQVLILLVFIARLLLAYLPAFEVDMNTWLSWSERLSTFGPGGFYSENTWTQYTPGILYWLWLMGTLGLNHPLIIKLPVILVDIATGLIIFKALGGRKEWLKRGAFLAYTLNPAVIFVGSVWGQIDGLLAFLLLGSAYLLVFRRSLLMASISWGGAFLVKPQAVAFLPILLWYISRKASSLKMFFTSSITALFVLGLALPFFPENPFWGLPQMIIKMGQHYHFTSIFAFNFWSLPGMWLSDSQEFLKLPFIYWGVFLYALALFLIFSLYRKRVIKKGYFLLVSALFFFSFFLFPTRVHERYFFPVLPFLLLSALRLRSHKLLLAYAFLSLLFLINLYHAYAYYSANFLRSEALLNLTTSLVPVIALAYLLTFSIITFWRKS